MNNIWKYSLILAFSIILDQLIKGTSQSLILEDGGISNLIGPLSFVRFKNAYLIFGFNISTIKSYQNSIAILFSSGIIVYSLKEAIKNRNISPITGWSYTLMIAGFFTSWLDRISQGFTLDYLGLNFGSTLVTFSLGDILSVCGFFLLGILKIKKRSW
ncbi:MAG: signal peptidase II [Bacteriovoracaceae bacterium]|nr:signal peptidase II [Bacteriovoracaceae bacterium]